MSNKSASSFQHRNNSKSASRFSDKTVRLLIGSVSLIAILVIAVPWISEYFRLSTEVAEMNSLHSQFNDTQSRKEKIESIEPVLSGRLRSASTGNICPEAIERVREELVAIVRDSSASLRRLEVGENIVRPWGIGNDDPHQDASPGFGEESGFVLHKHTVQLQADGSLESVKKILLKVKDTRWLVATKSLTISPNSARESPVMLNVQWILFGIEHAPEEDLFDESFDGEEFAFRANTETANTETRR